jgi:hypothetical protein
MLFPQYYLLHVASPRVGSFLPEARIRNPRFSPPPVTGHRSLSSITQTLLSMPRSGWAEETEQTE